jgi:hypothetical protein
MKRILCALSLGLFFSLAAPSALAVLVITNASPEWVLIQSEPGTFTFGLPAASATCGIENELTCEPTGIFYGNIAWTGQQQYIAFTDDEGNSDIITFDSLGPGGVFRVQFFSDPNPGSLAPPDGYTLFGTFAEGANGVVTGPLGICCEFLGAFVNLASDGEAVFDPFGLGADSSDEIQFTGNVAVVPEPATLAQLGVALAGLGFSRRRKANQAPSA